MRTHRTGHARRRWIGLISGAAAAVLITSCSSSGASSDSGSSGKASPIVIGSMAPVGTPEGDWGGIFAALNASAAVINEHGGINGHPLQVFTCNTQYQPNQELACAQSAVANHVVAMVGMLNDFQGAALEKILSDAHIADLENTGPLTSSFQGENTFPLTWEIGSFIPCVSKVLADQAHANSVVLVQERGPIANLLATPMENAARASGLKVLPRILTPPNVSDYSPYVAQAEQSGAGMVVIQLVGSGPQAFVRATSDAGAKYAVCTALGLSGSGGWAGLGSASNQVYVGATFKPLSQAKSLPLLQTMLSSMAAEQAKGVKDAATSPQNFQAQTMAAWLGVQAFAQVAKTIKGDVTGESFLTAIAHAKVNLGGIIPDVDFSQNQGIAPYDRVFNSEAYLWKWDPATSQYLLIGSVPNTLKLSSK